MSQGARRPVLRRGVGTRCRQLPLGPGGRGRSPPGPAPQFPHLYAEGPCFCDFRTCYGKAPGFPEKPEFQVGPQREEGGEESRASCSSLGDLGAPIKPCSKGAGETAQTGGRQRPTPHLPLTSCAAHHSPPLPTKQGRQTEDLLPAPGMQGCGARGGPLCPRKRREAQLVRGTRQGHTDASWLDCGECEGWEMAPGAPGRGVARGSTLGPCGLKGRVSQEALPKGSLLSCLESWQILEHSGGGLDMRPPTAPC